MSKIITAAQVFALAKKKKAGVYHPASKVRICTLDLEELNYTADRVWVDSDKLFGEAEFFSLSTGEFQHQMLLDGEFYLVVLC